MRYRLGVPLDQDSKRGLTLIAPPFLYAVALMAGPMLAIVLFSFWTQDYLTIDRTLTLANYREALTDPIYRAIMGRSLWISGLVTLITVLLAFPVAYYVSFRVRPDRKSLWLFLITIPFWTSYLLRIFLWKVILGYNGVLNSILDYINVPLEAFGNATGILWMQEGLSAPLYSASAVVLTLSHAFAPFAILPIFVALEKIDRSLLEAARDLGETALTAFFRVTLPLAAPGIVAALLIVFIPTVGDYVTPAQVGGPGGLMIANMIQTQFLGLNNAPMGATLAVIAMILVTIIALATVWLARRLAGGPR
ncbi:MAG: ABC transporter permease [Jannaschia helgolandensis]|jgi:spermidine/putrescine transport system permease protein|uniref:Spermidine/putrescine transport system permease protein n=1 Tax=Jannaschia helgolandensis TaxID=188906 RepID=A0A1H7P0R5_9RHOB|nr:ABC transporter permease [Jannaschia helgolandensis]SEL29064.1 spermidine/putrescine transport system permease protein [Jannaschia helgolandensis]|tara:strand:+ start:3026 stop:3946 length:921 start_codon:yes stop_codon:yes gene_type:complete